MIRTTHLVSLIAVCVALTLLGGCGAATNSIKGKVIQGNQSFVLVVDQNDERLKTEGLADVAVDARPGSSRATVAVFATAKSNSKGEFRLDFKDQQQVLLRPVEFNGEKDGFNPAKVVMNLPASERRLLIIMRPTGASHPPPPPASR